MLEGTLEYDIDGQPPRTVSAGEALMVPPETIHAVRNVGSGNASELATYVVEKGSRSSCWSTERRPPKRSAQRSTHRMQPSLGSSAGSCAADRDVRGAT